MIKTEDIALVADTPLIFPDPATPIKNVIDGDARITSSEIQKYAESALSFGTAGTVTIEFDYGLGFNESFDQTKQNQGYYSPVLKQVRLTSVGQANTAILSFSGKIGGL